MLHRYRFDIDQNGKINKILFSFCDLFSPTHKAREEKQSWAGFLLLLTDNGLINIWLMMCRTVFFVLFWSTSHHFPSNKLYSIICHRCYIQWLYGDEEWETANEYVIDKIPFGILFSSRFSTCHVNPFAIDERSKQEQDKKDQTFNLHHSPISSLYVVYSWN